MKKSAFRRRKYSTRIPIKSILQCLIEQKKCLVIEEMTYIEQMAFKANGV